MSKINSYFHFLKKLIVFLLIVFISDYLIGKVLEFFYYKQNNGIYYRTSYSINQTKADLLIFGSSRANHHYDPEVFENKLKLSSYNTGRNGTGIVYYYSILKTVLKRYSPKYIVLDIRPDEFIKTVNSYERLSMLLPYYKTHPELDSLIKLRSSFEKFKLLSFIYPYNSSLVTITLGNFEFNKKRDIDIMGYLPFYGEIDPNNQLDKLNETSKEKLDSNYINMYIEFLKNCISSNVKVYVFISPKYYQSGKKESSITIAKQIANKYNVPFFDFTNDKTYIGRNDYFNDSYHLNHKGAVIYSNVVCSEIQKTL